MLRPGGALLIANLNSFNTACADIGWMHDGDGSRRQRLTGLPNTSILATFT